MIDLSHVRSILAGATLIAQQLDGTDLTDLPEQDSSSSAKSKQEIRTQKVHVSRDLGQLADGLSLAAALVRNEYWVFKGGTDFDAFGDDT